ncbi:MAG: polysaccharide biosynthesis tyrosine autokinase [Candidatus Omnitrophica bacterium]|nr:polysaccharide biosynthesis tyrosine autokinase [Candidatus Omnitrophota bacterium]
MLPSAQGHEAELKDYIQIVKKQKWLIALVAFVLVIVVAIASFRMTPIYKAVTVLLIEKVTPKIVNIEDIYGTGPADREYYETQYKILASRSLAKLVFDELNLWKDGMFAKSADPISSFLGHLDIVPIRNSRLVNIGFKGADPLKITKIVNALAKVYIREDLERRLTSSREAIERLSVQLDLLKDKVEESDKALQDYKEKENIITLPAEQEKVNSFIENMRKEKARLEAETAEMEKRYLPKHPKTIRIKSEFKSVEQKIKDEEKKILGLNKKTIQYNVLLREMETNRELYNSLLKRAKETGVSEELKSTNIRVIDAAEVPKSPISPKKKRNIILALMIGLIIGTSGAFFVEYLDNTIKTADDIEQFIGLPFLGYIPNTGKEAKKGIQKDIDLIAHNKPRSTITEAYRNIRTGVLFSVLDKPIKTILVTSGLPGEGKTTVSINLATVMAQAGDKVLLVETDMRKPRFHKTFNTIVKEGLSSVLVGEAKLEDCIKATDVPNLFVLVSGLIPPNPSELLNSQKMREFLQGQKGSFDRLILDSPPILTVTDSAILANIVDGVIDVIQGGKTEAETVLRTKQKLTDARAHILGLVINNINIRREDYNYYSYYYYGKSEEKNV